LCARPSIQIHAANNVTNPANTRTRMRPPRRTFPARNEYVGARTKSFVAATFDLESEDIFFSQEKCERRRVFTVLSTSPSCTPLHIAALEEEPMRNILCGLAVALALTAAASVQLRASAPSGAIFTTLVDGSAVNYNIYAAKEDVYLDGGPGQGAPQ